MAVPKTGSIRGTVLYMHGTKLNRRISTSNPDWCRSENRSKSARVRAICAEIPVNLVDLGLIHGVQIENRVVNVTMTLTAPGCQMGMMITQDIQDKLLGIPGCDDASVEIVWAPPMDPHMMTEAAKKQLKIDD